MLINYWVVIGRIRGRGRDNIQKEEVRYLLIHLIVLYVRIINIKLGLVLLR
jgi:hypothetical protein